jgi:hypothetical protein
MAKSVFVNGLTRTVIRMSELMNGVAGLEFSNKQLRIEREILRSPSVRSLLGDGYMLIPTLPWAADMKSFLRQVAGYNIVNLQENGPVCKLPDCKKEVMPAASFIALIPLPVAASLDKNYPKTLSSINNKVERIPTAVELLYIAFVCRLLKGEVLAPGYILRTSTVGELPGSHLAVSCSERDRVSVFSIRDSAWDSRLGTVAIRVL